MIYACQVTALVGIGTVIFVTILSLLVGVASGYFGGKLDFIVQRFVDIWLSFPAIFLILTLLAVLNVRPGISGFFGLGRGPDVGLPAGALFWDTSRARPSSSWRGACARGGASRVVRASVLSTKANPYIEAATVIGATHTRTIFRHVSQHHADSSCSPRCIGHRHPGRATISSLGQGVTNSHLGPDALRADADVRRNHITWRSSRDRHFLAVFGFNMLGDALRTSSTLACGVQVSRRRGKGSRYTRSRETSKTSWPPCLVPPWWNSHTFPAITDLLECRARSRRKPSSLRPPARGSRSQRRRARGSSEERCCRGEARLNLRERLAPHSPAPAPARSQNAARSRSMAARSPSRLASSPPQRVNSPTWSRGGGGLRFGCSFLVISHLVFVVKTRPHARVVKPRCRWRLARSRHSMLTSHPS